MCFKIVDNVFKMMTLYICVLKHSFGNTVVSPFTKSLRGIILHVLINNSRTLWLIKILMPFLVFSYNLLQDAKAMEKGGGNCFTGGRTSQVGSVGRDMFFFFFFSKMTLKTRKFVWKNQTFLQKIFLENILIHFRKLPTQILRLWTKNFWFYKILAKF